MHEPAPLRLTRWQRLRTRAFLFAVGVKRHMTLGARVVPIDGDKVFLIRHTYLPGWQCPGGGVEPGESAEDAAGRELFEETGMRATAPMQLFGLFHNVSSTTNRDHVALFICREFEVARPFAPDAEIAEGAWFDHSSLPENTTASARRRISEIFGEKPPASTW